MSGSKVIVLGLDGVPISLVREFTGSGLMPNFKKLLARGSLGQMSSIYPTVSNIAWTTFQTGKEPSNFGIYGFIDINRRNYNFFIPNSLHLKEKTIQELVSEAGKRVIMMGVPNTYPPKKINGIMITDFLTPTIQKGAYPASLIPRLISKGYMFDVNPQKSRESIEYFMDEIVSLHSEELKQKEGAEDDNED